MNATELLAEFWFNHEVIVGGGQVRTAWGVKDVPGTPVMADVNASSQTVAAPNGEEVVVSATITWHPDGPVPSPGDQITLPPEFGLKPNREIITVKVEKSGTGLTPDHIEVTCK